jgi:hypothetical protein
VSALLNCRCGRVILTDVFGRARCLVCGLGYRVLIEVEELGTGGSPRISPRRASLESPTKPVSGGAEAGI